MKQLEILMNYLICEHEENEQKENSRKIKMKGTQGRKVHTVGSALMSQFRRESQVMSDSDTVSENGLNNYTTMNVQEMIRIEDD